MSRTRARERWVRITGWFLVVSYAVASPLTAYAEYQRQALSQRFELPPELIYLTCAAQVVCSIALFVRALAPWACAVLSIITLGAIGSHLRIESPVTALPAIVYTALQIWYGLESRAA